jgi:hypothetical protein
MYACQYLQSVYYVTQLFFQNKLLSCLYACQYLQVVAYAPPGFCDYGLLISNRNHSLIKEEKMQIR